MLDANHPALFGRSGHALTDSLIFSGNSNPISDVVVGGKQVISEGHHKDEEKIARAYRKAVGDLMA